jgi:hypothetical protein
VIFFDEWAHKKWGALGMLNTEAVMGLLGMLIFISIYISVNRIRPILVPIADQPE